MTAVCIERNKFAPGYVVSTAVPNFAVAARIAGVIVDTTAEAFDPDSVVPATTGEAALVQQIEAVDAPTDEGGL